MPENNSGWIKLHREIQGHWLWDSESEPFTRLQAWLDILMTVNYTEGQFRVGNDILICGRGESLNSLPTWSRRWRWTVSKVNRFLKLLEKSGEIQIKNETTTTRITVCKYDSYQDDRNDNETEVKRMRNGSEMEVKSIKEGKKEKKGIRIPNGIRELAPQLFEVEGKEDALAKKYQEVISNIPAGSDRANYVIAIKEFITENRPAFLAPYLDIWDLFRLGMASKGFKFSEASYTETRARLLIRRLKEPKFDFLKILNIIQASPFLRGDKGGWKISFEWILENESNYLKIIEGTYSN